MRIILSPIFFILSHISLGEIILKPYTYKQENTELEGYVAYNSKSGKKPGVLIVHDWMGVSDYTKERAKQLADLGYVAFVADIYGKGIRPKDAKEAKEQASKYKADRNLMRLRVKVAADELAKLPQVASDRIAAIGYCFGGTTVLELARSGYPVSGVVSFHGGLDTPVPGKDFKTKILVLHGADDPFVPEGDIKAFQKEMRDGRADWQMIYYANAVHAFTVPAAGSDNRKGAAYNELADKRSFAHMKDFFTEIFSQ